jgi:hypothetical protein
VRFASALVPENLIRHLETEFLGRNKVGNPMGRGDRVRAGQSFVHR